MASRKALIGMLRAAALSATMFLAGGAVPLLGFIALMLSLSPILNYAVGRSRPLVRMLGAIALTAGLIWLAAGVIPALGHLSSATPGSAGLALWKGALPALGFLASFGLAGVIITLMVEREAPFELIVSIAALAMLAATTIGLVLLAGSPQALAGKIHEGLSHAMARSDEFYKMLGLDLAQENETRTQLLDLSVRLSPALAALAAAFAVLANLGVYWRWAGRERLRYQLFGQLSHWHAPEWLIWLLLATGFGLFIPLEAPRIFAADAFVCVATIYFCQGLAILAYYFRILTMPVAVRGLIYMIILVQPVLTIAVCLAGVFDMWIDFRRLKPPSQEAGSFGDFF